MNWVDVCGAPGSGKSTLCDPIYGPHDIDFAGVTQFSPHWQEFLKVCGKLMAEVKDHPSFVAMDRMLWRSLRKMSVVECMLAGPDDVYIQTGLAQRGLGFGWRLHDLGKVELVREFFQKMPISLGVALVSAPVAVIEERNRLREQVKETAHENRSAMVPKMQPAIAIMKEVLRERRAPFIEIDSTEPIDIARGKLKAFAATMSGYAAQARSGSQVAPVPRVA